MDRHPFGPAIATYVSFPRQDTLNRTLSGDGSHEEVEIYEVPVVSVLEVRRSPGRGRRADEEARDQPCEPLSLAVEVRRCTVDELKRMKEFEPEAPGLEVATSLPSLRVIPIPEQLIERYGIRRPLI